MQQSKIEDGVREISEYMDNFLQKDSPDDVDYYDLFDDLHELMPKISEYDNCEDIVISIFEKYKEPLFSDDMMSTALAYIYYGNLTKKVMMWVWQNYPDVNPLEIISTISDGLEESLVILGKMIIYNIPMSPANFNHDKEFILETCSDETGVKYLIYYSGETEMSIDTTRHARKPKTLPLPVPAPRARYSASATMNASVANSIASAAAATMAMKELIGTWLNNFRDDGTECSS